MEPAEFAPTEYSGVRFSDSQVPAPATDGRMSVGDFGIQSFGNGLATYGPGNFTEDDLRNGFAPNTSHLVLRFDVNHVSLGLYFGNDDPAQHPEWTGFKPAIADTTYARLDLLLNNVLVAQRLVPLNANDLMDQFVFISATSFNEAHFGYYTGDGSPLTLAEIVDNVTIDQDLPPVNVVPEPSTYLAGLLILIPFGVQGIRFLRIRR